MYQVRRHWRVIGLVLLSCIVLGGVAGATAMGASKNDTTSFSMVRSAAAEKAGCLPHASARVFVHSTGPVEVMTALVSGLPANTDFDFFVIQVPNTPFGLAWYQGDIETHDGGFGTGVFVGRFSIETFIVATGNAPAPVVHDGPFPDASLNPITAPVHTYHLGLWFNSPADAVKAGCRVRSPRSTATTPRASRSSARVTPPTTKGHSAR